MKKTSQGLLLAVLLAPLAASLAVGAACGSPPPAADAPQAPSAAPAEAAPAAEAPKTAETAPKTDNRVLADSGLGVGGKLRAFQITNCESGEEYCQVCRYGASPKIMAVGDVDDPAFRTDLQNIDAVVKKYGEDKLKAFGVIAEIHDGKGLTPKEDREALIAKVKAMREELGITIPVVVPALEEGGGNEAFDGYYNITKSRTLMFADSRNAVRYSATAPSDLAGLNAAIVEVLGGGAPAEAPAEG